MAALSHGSRLGPFELVAQLGRGPVSEVWSAFYPDPSGRMRRVALKRLRSPSQALRESFAASVRRALSIDHPHVVRGLELWEAGDEVASVMELVDGISLAELIEDSRRTGASIPPSTAVWIAREWVRALVDLQAQVTGGGLEHRHVRPSNILLARSGEVKLSDYLVARATNDRRLVGDLAREEDTDCMGTAWTLVSLLLGRDLSIATPTEQRQALGGLAAGPIRALLESIATEQISSVVDLEDEMARVFFGTLGGDERKDGTPAVAALVRAAFPSIEAHRPQPEGQSIQAPRSPSVSNLPTEITRTPTPMTDALAAFEDSGPVVPSPLTAQDIPAGFTKDVRAAPLPITDTGPTDKPAPARVDAAIEPPKLAGPVRLPEPSSSKNPVSVTRSTEAQISFGNKAAFAFLWFSAGVLAATVAMYLLMR